MSNKPRIPTKEVRMRHLAKMRELNRRMDRHIIDLDELNAGLEESLREQRRRIINGSATQQIPVSSNE